MKTWTGIWVGKVNRQQLNAQCWCKHSNTTQSNTHAANYWFIGSKRFALQSTFPNSVLKRLLIPDEQPVPRLAQPPMKRDQNFKSGLPLYCICDWNIAKFVVKYSTWQNKIFMAWERSVAVFDCIGRSTEWTTVNHANWKPQSVRKYDAEIWKNI